MRRTLMSVMLIGFACVVSVAMLMWFGQESVSNSFLGVQTLHYPYLVAY